METGPEPRSKLWEEAYIHFRYVTDIGLQYEYAVSMPYSGNIRERKLLQIGRKDDFRGENFRK